MVGRTPRSARVPLDPLPSRRITSLAPTTSRPGGRLRTGGPPHLVFSELKLKRQLDRPRSAHLIKRIETAV